MVVWALAYREGPISREGLERYGKIENLDGILSGLIAEGRVRTKTGNSGEIQYVADAFFVPLGSAAGWEAAVFDHFQAVVKTICTKLTSEPTRTVGGSTYSFEVWSGHPLEAEVLDQLERMRNAASDLRGRVCSYNEGHVRPPEALHVTFYAGQHAVAFSDETELGHAEG
jgi:hypothetical protein